MPSGRRTTPRSPSWIARTAAESIGRAMRRALYSALSVVSVTRFDDMRLRQHAGGDGAIGVRQLQQPDLRRPEGRGQVGLQRGPYPHLVSRPDHRADADFARDPHGHGVAGLGEGLAHRDRPLELVVVVRDLLEAEPVPCRHFDRLVRHGGVEGQSRLERGQVDQRFHRGARLAQRARDAVVVGVAAVAALEDPAPASLGEDRRVGVREHDHRTLNHALPGGMALLVERQPVLERVVHDRLYAGVHRRSDHDAPLEQVVDEAGPGPLVQLGEDVVDRSGRVGLVWRDGRDPNRFPPATRGEGL